MASSIFFNGRRINIPQAVSQIDASALSTISPSAVGIVALVGTAEGGVPLSVLESDSDMTRSGQVFEKFRTGDLKTASLFAFEPSTDEAVPNGAQKIVAVKVNPATRSTVTLQDTQPQPALILTSRDYGLFTEQINATVETGTTGGKKVALVFEDSTEVFDDLGIDVIMTATYVPGAEGYDAMQASGNTQSWAASGSKDMAGLVTERANDIPAPGVLSIVSDNVLDTSQRVTIFGLDASSAPIKTSVVLNGTTPQVSSGLAVFSKVTACQIDAAAAGTVTISDSPVTTTLFTLSAGTLTRGLVLTTNMATGSTTPIAIDVADPSDAVVRGLDANGVEVFESFDLTAVVTAATVAFASVTQVELGDVPAARTVQVSSNTIALPATVYSTVQKMVDKINDVPGFTATADVKSPSTFSTTYLDQNLGVNMLNTVVSFYAVLQDIIATINANSAFVSAARATFGDLPPANTPAPAYLVGGSEGTTTITQWQQAFELLRKRRVTTIVPLTQDPAVHNLLATHLVERAGRLRSEANGYIGIGTTDGVGETRANIKSQIRVLNTRHISALSEECERFDPVTGVATWYPPYIYASIAAGMQAGSPIGEPLTRKRPNITNIRNDSSWAVENDASEMIDAGLMFSEKTDTTGIRWVRSITTHISDDNVVFVELSANEAANTAVFRFRTQMELKIGQRGLAGSPAAIKGLANDELGRLVDDDVIVAYRALQVEQIGDVFPVSVEIAPVLPINFIPITVHLVAVRAAA